MTGNTALEQLLRQAGACARAAREQAAALEPARVRADLASAEAGRRRAEAAAVTAAARQAEAEAETRALAEALAAARDDTTAAQAAARDAGETAARLTAELDQLRRDTAVKITAADQTAREQAAAARAHAARCERERDDAAAVARDAAAETARARQAEADARAETGRLRDDAARERDALSASHAAQIQARQALTDAERGRAERAEAQLETLTELEFCPLSPISWLSRRVSLLWLSGLLPGCPADGRDQKLDVAVIQPGDRFLEVDGDTVGQARGDLQHSPLAPGASEARAKCADDGGPVDDSECRAAADGVVDGDEPRELGPVQPVLGD